MKHYRNLNGCVSKMHRVIYDAYDKGYAQGRKDYEKAQGEWEPEAVGGLKTMNYISFRCSICKSLVIAKYNFCPHCGSPMTEDAYGEKKD